MKRPKNRGLLAIYPLNPNSKTKERSTTTYSMEPLKAENVVFAVMLVFPEDEKNFIGNFIVNATV